MDSAPSNSIYAPYDTTVLLAVNSTVTNSTLYPNSNVTVFSNITTTSSFYQRRTKTVTLDPINDLSQSIFTTCFRPDVGGQYVVRLTMRLKGNTICPITQVSTITVGCSTIAPSLSTIGDMTVPVDRDKPTRVWLNATTVTDMDTDKGSLIYNWKVIYPLSGVYVYGVPFPLTSPVIYSPQSMVSSFWVPQSNVDYIIELSVSDHCNVQIKNITIHTPCSVTVPLQNTTLVSTYDGLVPVQFMSFAYDHTYEVASILAYPKCQLYFWTLYDYSTSYSADAFSQSGTTAFTKTSGFAGLISAVVIVAVLVPVILWLYCTKKACFKGSGSTGV